MYGVVCSYVERPGWAGRYDTCPNLILVMFSKLGTRSLQSEHTTTCSTATEPACSDVRPGPRPRHQSKRALSFLSSDWSRGEEAERGESRWSLCWTTGEDSHLLHGHFLSCSLCSAIPPTCCCLLINCPSINLSQLVQFLQPPIHSIIKTTVVN